MDRLIIDYWTARSMSLILQRVSSEK